MGGYLSGWLLSAGPGLFSFDQQPGAHASNDVGDMGVEHPGSPQWLVAGPEILREGCCAVQVLAAGFKDGARAGGLLGARRWVCAAGAAATLACL